MIPLTPKSSLTEAKYTKLLDDISNETMSALNRIFDDFDEDMPDELVTHFFSMYRYYEICDEDESVFLQCVSDIYNEHANYYKKILQAYKNDIDITKITERTSSRQDQSAGSKTSTGTSLVASTDKRYDLPNSQVTGQDGGYLSEKGTEDSVTNTNLNDRHTNAYNTSTTSKDNRDFISAKVEYLRHIRDIYEEFVSEFKECFILVY